MSENLQELTDAWFDGTATPEMVEKLNRALVEDEEFRTEFVVTANLIAELPQVLCGEEPVIEMPVVSTLSRPPSTWQLLAFAASIVFMLGAMFYLLRTVTEIRGPGNTAASLELGEGQAQFEGRVLNVGDRFDPPGRLVALGEETVVFRYPDGSRLILEEGAALRLEGGETKKMFLEQGALQADIKPQSAGSEVSMETSNSRVTVLGTQFRLATAIVEDLLEVKHGRVRLEEKMTGEERIAERGEPYAIPGTKRNEFKWVIYPAGSVQTGPPARSYETRRWWFTEDFEPSWISRIWEIAEHDSQVFEPLVKSGKDFALELALRKGLTTTVLKMSRPPGTGPPIRMRLRRVVGWNSFFMQYFYQPLGEKPLDMNPLCLDYPAGTEWETIYQHDEPEPLVGPETWNHVRMEYIRYRDGKQWQLEVRRHLNGEHRSTTRLKIAWTPALLFEVNSGACFLDQISVGELFPKQEEAY
ncbi:MAG: hypothetical protein ACI8UO_004123 [Verrucomicrobiales bacterium]|jgi:hypothetical protein